MEDVDIFRTKLPGVLSAYQPQDIYNADETPLYYLALPDRTLVGRKEQPFGSKVSRNRLTVLLAGNAAGGKLPPLVVGKYANPRCFRGLHTSCLPCKYASSKNAWMTKLIFEEWLTDLNRKMQIEGRHVLLFLDNASAHKTTRCFSNVELKFLPPNATSVIQPIDQGNNLNF